MPLSQQDAEGIGLNISRALFPGYHERRADRAAAADLKRKQALEEMVATIAQRNAMEQLREREAGDTARADRANAAAMERAILGENRADYRAHAQRGAMLESDRISAEQRMAANEEDNKMRRELAEAQRLQSVREYLADQRYKYMDLFSREANNAAQRRYEMMKLPIDEREALARAANSVAQLETTDYRYRPEVLEKWGLEKVEDKKGGVKPTKPTFKSVTLQPAQKIDYGAQAVTNSATNTPMPPDMNGQRRPSEAYSDVMGGSSFRELINVLTNKSFKP